MPPFVDRAKPIARLRLRHWTTPNIDNHTMSGWRRMVANASRNERKLLEEPIAVLNQLQSVSILAAGLFAQLRSDIAEIRSLFEIDEDALKKSVVLPEQTPPRPIDGRSADARLEDCERRAGELVSSWTDTLADSLNEPEMAEQISYLSDPAAKTKVEALARTRRLPDAIDDAFIEALNQVFVRVDIHHVTPMEITDALFPDTSPATADQLRTRLDTFIEGLVADVDAERVRFLPTGDDAS